MFDEVVYTPQPDVIGGVEVSTYALSIGGVVVFQESFPKNDEAIIQEKGRAEFARHLRDAIDPPFRF